GRTVRKADGRLAAVVSEGRRRPKTLRKATKILVVVGLLRSDPGSAQRPTGPTGPTAREFQRGRLVFNDLRVCSCPFPARCRGGRGVASVLGTPRQLRFL